MATLNGAAVTNMIVTSEELTCTWTYFDSYDDYHWDTTCGSAHYFEEGGPAENEYYFCPKCGRRIVEVRPETEKVEDDE